MSNLLSSLLLQLREDKGFFLKGNKGTDFEDRIQKALRDHGATRLLKRDMAEARFRQIKAAIAQKQSEDYPDVLANEVQHMMWQPYGSQSYPDFLLFSAKKIIPVEVKYSTGNSVKPVWNSNLPRPNGFYIFGACGKRDLTFFHGADVLGAVRRQELLAFFAAMKQQQDVFNKKIRHHSDEHARGFSVYVRKAFEQKAISGAQVDYFKHPQRQDVETKALTRAQELEV